MREHFTWTTPMDTAFIEAMLKEQEKGNRPNGTFTSEAYATMAEELSKSLKKDIRKDNLQNRLRTLKLTFGRYYDVFRGASLSGFSWDPVTKLMQAKYEVWEALIKMHFDVMARPGSNSHPTSQQVIPSSCVSVTELHKFFGSNTRFSSSLTKFCIPSTDIPSEKSDAANLRTKPIRHYNELMELFRKDRATGEASETAKERKNRMKQDEQPVETIDEIDELLETNEISLENFTTGDNEHVTPQVQLMGVKREDISHAYLFLVGNPEKTRALFGFPIEMRLEFLATLMDGNE
ncbi:Myb/SANT-like domain-containing protein [Tanacetum coccineum]